MNKIKLGLFAAMLTVSSVARADATSGYISHIESLLDDHSVLFNQSGTRSGIPSCGTAFPVRWAIDVSTALGQAELSILLTAYSLHKPIIITGAGSCAAHLDTETVRYIVIDG